MMRLPLSMLLAAFFAAGCTGHFYREEADRVYFFLKDSQATAVHFASSQDGFVLHRTDKTGPKTWQITVPKTGEFRYFFLVDGKILLADCPYREMDDFGSYNCLYKPDP